MSIPVVRALPLGSQAAGASSVFQTPSAVMVIVTTPEDMTPKDIIESLAAFYPHLT